MTEPWLADVPDEIAPGTADLFSARISSFALTDQSRVDAPLKGVTAIVGGNNVGKSTLLKDLRDQLSLRRGQQLSGFRLIESLECAREGASGDLIAWLGQHASYVQSRGASGFKKAEARPLTPPNAITAWDQTGGDRLAELSPFLLFYADATGRLGLAQSVEHRADIGDPPTHPLHYLQDSQTLLSEIQDISKHIFRKQLTLDRLSGKISLRVGDVHMQAPPVDSVTTQYREALASLPHLEDQGDGMKSLLGLLLPLITASHEIVLVDEPEAFLHPPQARALGASLAKIANDRNLQVILATHDRNILSGLLEVEDVDVSVVRLSREGDTTTAHQLNPDELREIWSQPVLKYSNALDGVFHRLVVIAEGDPDCRFYNAALDSAYDHSHTQINPAEVLFMPSGGKSGMPKLAEALQALEVEVVLTPDLDILQEEGILKGAVEALGGDWGTLAGTYQRATNMFRAQGERPRCGTVLKAVRSTLEPKATEPFTKEVRKELQAQMRLDENPWRALKDYGDRAFKGEASSAAEKLLGELDDLGIVLVRVGELEGFARDLGVSKGPAWLAAALEQKVYEREAALDHVRRITMGRT